MSRNILFLSVATASLALAGCAKKAPEVLPPTPVDTSADNNGYGDGSVAGAVIPGSQADFVARVSSDTVYFDTDRYDIDGEDRAVLQSQAEWLRQYPNVRVTVEGHADERGTRDYNIALGERRANSAKNYLASLGIDPSRISTVSYGKEKPVALGSNESAWAQNRRAVTVTIG
jgi:peptidoglycan-associated lipoprotein